jgi:hypothetical protein
VKKIKQEPGVKVKQETREPVNVSESTVAEYGKSLIKV